MILNKISYFFVDFFHLRFTMANKETKTKQKSLASDIVSSIETKLSNAGEATKKMKKAVEKSAEKLTKLMNKRKKENAKPSKSAEKKAKKSEVKAKKNAAKAAKNAQRAANIKASEAAKTVVAIDDTKKSAPVRTKATTAPKPTATPKPRPAPTQSTETVESSNANK